MSSVVFSPSEFKQTYPEFMGVPDLALEGLFAQAEIMLNNGDCSPVSDLTKRKTLLYLLVAHLASLRGYKPIPGSGTYSSGAQPVGMLSSATEGSVSISYDNPGNTKNSAWYMQSQYGAIYWEMIKQLRTFLYINNPQRWR